MIANLSGMDSSPSDKKYRILIASKKWLLRYLKCEAKNYRYSRCATAYVRWQVVHHLKVQIASVFENRNPDIKTFQEPDSAMLLSDIL